MGNQQFAMSWHKIRAWSRLVRPVMCLSLLLLTSSATFAAGKSPTLPNGNEMPIVMPDGTVTDSGMKQIPGFWQGPGNDDLMVRMLQMSLGDPVAKASRYLATPLPGSEGPVGSMTVMAEVLAVAPSIALAVGGILGLYFIFGGLLNTGRDGEFLGQKWDSWYTPFRVGISTASILPAPGFGGLANIQVVVLALSLLGIGMGSALWLYSAEKLLTTPIIIPQPASIGSLAADTLKAQVCAAIENRNLTGKATVPPTTGTGGATVSSGYYNNPVITTKVESVLRIGSCGTVSFPVPFKGSESEFSFFQNSTEVFQNVMKQMGPAQRDAYVALYGTLAGLVPTIVDDNKTLDQKRALSSKYAAAVNTYNNALLQSGRDVIKNTDIAKSNEALLKDVKKLGFAMAGSFFYVLQAHQDQIYGGIEQSRPQLSLTTERFLATRAATMDGAENEFSRSMQALDKMLSDYAVYEAPQDSLERVQEVASNNAGEWELSQALSFVSAKLAEITTGAGTVGTNNSDDMPDPLMEIKHLGNRLQAAYLAGVVIQAALTSKDGERSWMDNMVSKLPIGFLTRTVSAVVDTVFGSILPYIFLFGFLLSNIVPAIPFIMYSMAIMGYLIYLYEAYFAAPFWVAMHGTPEGHSITGQGASGYPILLTLVLRPVLIVVGLLFAMTIVRIMGWFLKQTVFGTVEIINVGGFNVTSVLGHLAVYAALMAAIISKSYALTYELPNAILKWMGVGTHHADLGEGEGQRSTMMIAGKLTQGMNRTVRPEAIKTPGAPGDNGAPTPPKTPGGIT